MFTIKQVFPTILLVFPTRGYLAFSLIACKDSSKAHDDDMLKEVKFGVHSQMSRIQDRYFDFFPTIAEVDPI